MAEGWVPAAGSRRRWGRGGRGRWSGRRRGRAWRRRSLPRGRRLGGRRDDGPAAHRGGLRVVELQGGLAHLDRVPGAELTRAVDARAVHERAVRRSESPSISTLPDSVRRKRAWRREISGSPPKVALAGLVPTDREPSPEGKLQPCRRPLEHTQFLSGHAADPNPDDPIGATDVRCLTPLRAPGLLRDECELADPPSRSQSLHSPRAASSSSSARRPISAAMSDRVGGERVDQSVCDGPARSARVAGQRTTSRPAPGTSASPDGVGQTVSASGMLRRPASVSGRPSSMREGEPAARRLVLRDTS